VNSAPNVSNEASTQLGVSWVLAAGRYCGAADNRRAVANESHQIRAIGAHKNGTVGSHSSKSAETIGRLSRK